MKFRYGMENQLSSENGSKDPIPTSQYCNLSCNAGICVLYIHSKISFYETGKVRGEEFNN